VGKWYCMSVKHLRDLVLISMCRCSFSFDMSFWIHMRTNDRYTGKMEMLRSRAVSRGLRVVHRLRAWCVFRLRLSVLFSNFQLLLVLVRGHKSDGPKEYICQSTNHLLCSSSASPSCVTYARASDLFFSDVQYSYGCGTLGGFVAASFSPTAAKAPGKGNNDEANRVTAGISTPAQRSVASRSNDVLDTFPTPGPGRSMNSASGASDAGSQRFKDNGLSAGVIVSIVIPIVAMIAAIIVAWWKRHQAVWCLTCGRHGYKHSSSVPSREGHPVSQMGKDTIARNSPPPYNSNQVFVINHINQPPHRMHDEALDRLQHEAPNRMHHGPPGRIYPLALEDGRWEIQHCEANLILTWLFITWRQSLMKT
jgi:hypothetical protein